MGTIFDVAFCAIALYFVISGFKIGFVRSLVGLVGSVFAIGAAIVLSNYLTGAVCIYLAKLSPVTMFGRTAVKVISIMVLFVIFQLLVQMTSRALDAVCKLPLLHGVNSLLGGVFGLVRGAVAVVVICAVLQLSLPFLTAKFPQIPKDGVAQSNIYKYVYAHNPVYLLYQAEI
ncbi:CvpA family protein [Caproiciproducens faecalis]|uniref:CvpA family protein n=1 Tax=Caproiciproducens faecalis TaxID=2820301 RepID=A0ABS7DJ57_9FIRM|nr:CvpA family protein [Caproiciproducens faecalis]MBW7571331.1 CvpA family protein [Caproiciproducens faecalis]